MENNEFNIFIPFEKSIRSDGAHGRFIHGYASTYHEDSVGDIVLPTELDISTFMTRGYINYEHKPGDRYKIGVPTDKTYIDPSRGLFVEAKLFDNNPYADRMWEIASRISSGEEEQKRDHMLGFSIEGSFSHRDVDDVRVMRNVRITNIALTVNPKNKNASWHAFTKSFTTGNDVIQPENPGYSEGALRAQSIARDLKNLSYAVQDLSPEDWRDVAKNLDQEDRYEKDTASLFLQVTKGISKEQANKLL